MAVALRPGGVLVLEALDVDLQRVHARAAGVRLLAQLRGRLEQRGGFRTAKRVPSVALLGLFALLALSISRCSARLCKCFSLRECSKSFSRFVSEVGPGAHLLRVRARLVRGEHRLALRGALVRVAVRRVLRRVRRRRAEDWFRGGRTRGFGSCSLGQSL